MISLNFFIIVFSALCHASYNLLIKLSDEKTTYMFAIFFVAVVVAWSFGLFYYGSEMVLPLEPLLYAMFSALFFTLYHIYAGKSYSKEDGDLSLAYPLTGTAPIFICLWASLFLNEPISLLAGVGIAIALVGSYCIQLKDSIFSLRFCSTPISQEVVRLALLASFFYSVGAITDKLGVNSANFFAFTTYLMSSICLYLFFASLRKGKEQIVFHFTKAPRMVFAGGLLLFLSNVSYRFALETSKVSYASSVRQIAALFAVLFGITLLKESYGAVRIASSILIIAGIVLVKFG